MAGRSGSGGVVVVVAVLAVAVWAAGQADADPASNGRLACPVAPAGLDQEQVANAELIADVGAELGVPERAVVVAIATAMQESSLRNLGHLGGRNDHDSLGLFQQRPSQGWGTPEQVQDRVYATETFYRALLAVSGWEQMRVTDAAQAVQRSAFPEAYAKHEDTARALARSAQCGGRSS